MSEVEARPARNDAPRLIAKRRGRSESRRAQRRRHAEQQSRDDADDVVNPMTRQSSARSSATRSLRVVIS